MKKLIQYVNELQTYIAQADMLNEKVSGSSVGWHIDHSLLVLSQIIAAMEASDPANYQYQFNLKRFFAFSLNRFPRGVAKAPKQVRPTETFNASNTIHAFETIVPRLTVLENLASNQFFLHPFFGKLNKNAAIKMLTIHTAHHILIIKDIIQKQA
ncbi:DUF1569 domain-containing protein [Sediminibacterium sp.]|uniref:DUF1569 domain-containing protein n=1 Tax=Sediminibacterium sp. TaxID=1917865 RepID=UPI003F70B3C5